MDTKHETKLLSLDPQVPLPLTKREHLLQSRIELLKLGAEFDKERLVDRLKTFVKDQNGMWNREENKSEKFGSLSNLDEHSKLPRN